MTSRVDTIRAAIEAKLAGISIINGYQTNAGANVKVHYGPDWSVAVMPGINILYTAIPDPDTAAFGQPVHTMPVYFNSHAVSGASPDTSLTDANKIADDITKAMYALRNDLITAQTIHFMSMEGGRTQQRIQNGDIFASVYTNFSIQFTTNYYEVT